ncbi:nickel pincer cofactor biosynthesis protein LarB [Candidatus Magnetaquicoccus inordinatus]|uniref:nickel pincer cofactor biosynthesis protein LarB n=1 Tax=Candidatus Magnetaquicoccus inordinatus TaxID=2496818 RepID=UPI00102AF9D0|nr:nickel pincer cofactor biosynthesis protein LarB [Candidatus Magnetaquicoccus inordinatus]
MSPEQLQAILTALVEGRATVPETMQQLQRFPVDPVLRDGQVVARLDTQRSLRHGFPEVILAQGKRFIDLQEVVERALSHGNDLLITRLRRKRMLRLQERFPELQVAGQSRCLYRQVASREPVGLVGVLCAGTSDIAVAEEAAWIARLLGARVECCYDVGVAGLHRLFAASALLQSAKVLVVVAGMEGALPSVVGGLVDKPVIAVPTSIGYGASLQGISALLGMLNSCSANVTVVNIDNGFGAGYVAGLINRGAAECR